MNPSSGTIYMACNNKPLIHHESTNIIIVDI